MELKELKFSIKAVEINTKAKFREFFAHNDFDTTALLALYAVIKLGYNLSGYTHDTLIKNLDKNKTRDKDYSEILRTFHVSLQYNDELKEYRLLVVTYYGKAGIISLNDENIKRICGIREGEDA